MAEKSSEILNPASTPPISCYVNFGYENSSIRIKCALCGLEKTSIDELEAHIGWDHMKWTPYQCGTCPAVLRPTDYTIRIHMQEVHPTEPQKTVYTPDEQKLRDLKNSIQKSLTGNIFSQISSNTVTLGEEVPENDPISLAEHKDSSALEESGNGQSSPYAFPTATFHASNHTSAGFIPPFPDFQFPLDSSLFQSQGSFLCPSTPSTGPTRQRKRQARHISQIGANEARCSLCDSIVSLDGLSHVNHVFQHVESSGLGSRFTCASEGCTFGHFKKSFLEQHSRKDHNGDFSLVQDNTSSLLAEFDVMKSRCFPGAPKSEPQDPSSLQRHIPSSSTMSSRGILTCAKCAKSVRRELVLRHVYEYHLSGKPLRCPYCPYATGYLLFNLRHHVSNCHSDKPMTLIDEREKYQPEVFRLRSECFPSVYQKVIPSHVAERHSSVSRSSGGSSGMDDTDQRADYIAPTMKLENGTSDS